MQPHLEARKDSDLTERAIKVAEIILAEFSHLSVDTELILKIMAILDINSFEIPSMDATVQVLSYPEGQIFTNLGRSIR